MPGITYRFLYTCARCLRTSRINASSTSPRRFSKLSPLREKQSKVEIKEDQAALEAQILTGAKSSGPDPRNVKPEQGAMSRRLAAATEDALLEGGRAGRRAVEDAGFSEELKQKLLEKFEAHRFRAENSSAFTEAGLSSHVGRGSKDIALGQAWTGAENTEDTMLRMLDDARKPLSPRLRGPPKVPSPAFDLRLKSAPAERPGQRLANAREKSSIYAISKDTQMTEKERDEMRKQLKERFGPTSRAMPNSIRGLAALANERIEDAIARGQFKNIPRGKAIQRDPRADNPFIDTTEYILNKMIQRQDIVPPWIEKQQELVKAANIFRARLRNDWNRHAARTIASQGGTLEEQMRLAEQYAESERIYNPRRRVVERFSVPTNVTEDAVMVKILQEVPTKAGVTPPVQVAVDAEILIPTTSPSDTPSGNSSITTPEMEITPSRAFPPPFRIPSWESSEMSYLTLAVNNLNSLARSYNLMAPDLAKKPYFSLERELKSCYADVAPILAKTLKERATRPPKDLVEKIGHHPGGVLERFAGGERARVYNNKKPLYGFKEFWRELWSAKSV